MIPSVFTASSVLSQMEGLKLKQEVDGLEDGAVVGAANSMSSQNTEENYHTTNAG